MRRADIVRSDLRSGADSFGDYFPWDISIPPKEGLIYLTSRKSVLVFLAKYSCPSPITPVNQRFPNTRSRGPALRWKLSAAGAGRDCAPATPVRLSRQAPRKLSRSYS